MTASAPRRNGSPLLLWAERHDLSAVRQSLLSRIAALKPREHGRRLLEAELRSVTHRLLAIDIATAGKGRPDNTRTA